MEIKEKLSLNMCILCAGNGRYGDMAVYTDAVKKCLPSAQRLDYSLQRQGSHKGIVSLQNRAFNDKMRHKQKRIIVQQVRRFTAQTVRVLLKIPDSYKPGGNIL